MLLLNRPTIRRCLLNAIGFAGLLAAAIALRLNPGVFDHTAARALNRLAAGDITANQLANAITFPTLQGLAVVSLACGCWFTRTSPDSRERLVRGCVAAVLAAATAHFLQELLPPMLKPIFDQHNGKNGRLSIQTDPRLYRNTDAIVHQALEFNQLAPNMIVKIPVTRAGIPAIEEATYRGVSINATVCFTLPQCVAVAEAVERGLGRREKEGLPIDAMGPVCTIMVGRLDDWLKVVAERENISVDPGYIEWAGVAVLKKTYKLFRERGYRIRLLSAAFRNHMHWSEFIGGDVVISPPYAWQVRFNASDVAIKPRMQDPVDSRVIDALNKNFTDFRRSYNEGGLTLEEFDSFGPTRRTMRQFIAACADLNSIVRDVLLPNPDTN